ncbi:uncharacterized protein RHO25_013198 [Cercospora beticola]|uniref:Uncharacterized protein n=1 Tax=Cercospora beticola TaxID=122368 RepID=A0ABZ0P9D4_CERBT|nr:hypothetical protein RHO25_013198 [Cercospora beticola]
MPEQLESCVMGCSETLRRERGARRAIEENWAGWNGIFGIAEYTPPTFSIGLLEKLAALARTTPGHGPLITGEIGRRTRHRLQTTRSTKRYVVLRDVEDVLKEWRRPVVAPAGPGSGHRSRSRSRSVEIGRGAEKPLVDRPSSLFVSGAPLDDDSAGPAGGLSLLDQLELDLQSASGRHDASSLAPPRSPSPPPPRSPSPAPPRSPSQSPARRGRRSVKDRIRSLLEREVRFEEKNGGDESAASRAWRSSTEAGWLDMLPEHWK